MRRAFVNARLLDPASGLDQTGGLLVLGEKIADIGPHIRPDQLSPDIEWVDCHGHCLAPGLVDMRTQFREPGEEHKAPAHPAVARPPPRACAQQDTIINAAPMAGEACMQREQNKFRQRIRVSSGPRLYDRAGAYKPGTGGAH